MNADTTIALLLLGFSLAVFLQQHINYRRRR